jgi:predicted house-cleaning noncanonical NTP pyrophosphatase (MazG superfamily)
MRLIKLVRDRIGTHFGEGRIVFRPIPREETILELRKKLVEEAAEYVVEPSLDELADLYAVLIALADHDQNVGFDKVILRAKEKARDRGTFEHLIGMYIERT